MVVLNWNIGEAKGGNQRILYRDYKRMDVDTFKSLIDLNININEDDSINEIASRIVDTIVECIDVVAPRRSIVIKNKRQGKQWFSEDIYELLNQRDLAHRAARLNSRSEDWILFKQLRNKVVDANRKAKREYLKSRLDMNKGEPKQMWKLLKEMLKGTSNNIECNELQCGNRIVNNVKEMAEEFNRYFVSSIIQLAEENDVDDLPIEITVEHPNSVFEQFDRIHERDLRNMVGKLVNKAGTEEGITVGVTSSTFEHSTNYDQSIPLSAIHGI